MSSSVFLRVLYLTSRAYSADCEIKKAFAGSYAMSSETHCAPSISHHLNSDQVVFSGSHMGCNPGKRWCFPMMTQGHGLWEDMNGFSPPPQQGDKRLLNQEHQVNASSMNLAGCGLSAPSCCGPCRHFERTPVFLSPGCP